MHKVLIFAAAAVLAAFTPGCATGPADLGIPPAETSAPHGVSPLGTTDDKAIILAMESYDLALTAVDAALDAGLIEPGSPLAMQIAEDLRVGLHWIRIANQAVDAGNATDFMNAMTIAGSAIARARQKMESS
jgi:hypothetical protein